MRARKDESAMRYCVFETRKGFVALLQRGGKLKRCVLPRATRNEAARAVRAGLDEGCVEDIGAFGDLPGKLVSYFDGQPVDFSGVAVDLSGHGAFHAAALRAAQKLRYGEVVTYGDLARMAGSEKAARAAGTAMARNATPIVVPCHRVVASGGLGGFSSGLDWKRELLSMEGVRL